MRAAIYLRVSTDGQTVENQRRELLAVAKRHGWEIAGEFIDRGISGAKGRDRRPGLDRLLKGVARREFDIVAAWSVDRLGRSLQHLVGLLGDLHHHHSVGAQVAQERAVEMEVAGLVFGQQLEEVFFGNGDRRDHGRVNRTRNGRFLRLRGSGRDGDTGERHGKFLGVT